MAPNAALVCSYGVPIPGREAKALENFADAMTVFGKLAADGKCTEPEALNRGYGGGMMIVRAETSEMLHEILMMDEVKRLIIVAEFTAKDFKYELYETGERLMEDMTLFTGIASELGYV